MKVSRFPFGPGQPRGRKALDRRARARVPRAAPRAAPRGARRRSAPRRPCRPAAPELELRLDQREHLAALREAGARPRAAPWQRDERDVDVARSGGTEGPRAAGCGRSRAPSPRRAGRCEASSRAGRSRRRARSTRAAPRWSRQSVKPPVEAPTSRQRRPGHVDARAPRERARASARRGRRSGARPATRSSASAGTSCPASSPGAHRGRA